MGARPVTRSVSFSAFHDHLLLVKTLCDVLPMDLPLLLGKCELFTAGLGPSMLPSSASYSSPWHLTRDISSRCSPARRASPHATAWVRSGTNELEVSSSWDPAQGWAAAVSRHPVPWGHRAADRQPARRVTAEPAGTSPDVPSWGNLVQPLFQRSI